MKKTVEQWSKCTGWVRSPCIFLLLMYAKLADGINYGKLNGITNINKLLTLSYICPIFKNGSVSTPKSKGCEGI